MNLEFGLKTFVYGHFGYQELMGSLPQQFPCVIRQHGSATFSQSPISCYTYHVMPLCRN